jgi:DNA (cytosine-5)-methyltransferase 1
MARRTVAVPDGAGGRPYSVVSMFSGCGGMDLGFEGGFSFMGKRYPRLPFDVVWANDLNPKASATYELNIGFPIKCGNVWDVLDTLPDRADVVIGGFPCQDLSINGLRRGVDGLRSGLYTAMLEAIRRTRPKVFVAENVKGLLMAHSRHSLERVIGDFGALGYDLSYKLYLAADYGVPQMRERVLIVGTDGRQEAFEPPPPVAGRESGWVTAREALADLEPLEEDPSVNHIWSKANVSPEQGNRKLKPDEPAKTIRAECHGNIQFHYRLPRRISMREAARIQSFPESFHFQGGIREIERQIGNAVPPVLGWHFARAVSYFLRGCGGV